MNYWPLPQSCVIYQAANRLVSNYVLAIRGKLSAIVKAMVDSGVVIDFITVDGSEGGTGAAPVEFTDHIGSPLRDALFLLIIVFAGAGLRDRVKIAASAKIVSAYDIVRHCALGADWCNMARPFMFAVGCIQARDCASSRCPSGVATMDPKRLPGS